jgi:hypothetical protein
MRGCLNAIDRSRTIWARAAGKKEGAVQYHLTMNCNRSQTTASNTCLRSIRCIGVALKGVVVRLDCNSPQTKVAQKNAGKRMCPNCAGAGIGKQKVKVCGSRPGASSRRLRAREKDGAKQKLLGFTRRC